MLTKARGLLQRGRSKVLRSRPPALNSTHEVGSSAMPGVDPDWLEVDRVLAGRRGAREVLVKWRGLGYEAATWEVADSLVGPQDAAALARWRGLRPVSLGPANFVQVSCPTPAASTAHIKRLSWQIPNGRSWVESTKMSSISHPRTHSGGQAKMSAEAA